MPSSPLMSDSRRPGEVHLPVPPPQYELTPGEARTMADASAWERAYQRLKSDILSGSISVGPLDIRILGDRLRMSVTPVREALARLHAERLVRLAPHQGYVVATPSARRLEHLYELSSAMVHLCLERASRSRRPKVAQARPLLLLGA